ncbi:MAG: zinc-dependent alcohol dehydrogenase family protein [Pseudomonadota bacterium]|nr:MAG: zinc-dependent alcohol dehydrogenase family protein [Pseudomonadota bacterium]
MKAVQMTTTGAPQVLVVVELAEPQIDSPTQLKVRLKAAGVNPVDTKIRTRGLFAQGELPAVLGCDGVGEVVETGKDVTRLRPGDDVWFCNGGLGGVQGNYAEFTVVDEQVARRKPRALTYIEAAAAPLVLITAWEALYHRARLQEGQTVLVHAGAGGVGHVAIQLAKHAGARVITTVSSEEKAQLARSLGADEAVLYRERDFVEAVNEWTGGRGVDVALDTLGGEVFRRTLDAVVHYGDVVTLLDPGTDVVWKEARNRNLRVGFELMLTPMLHDLQEARNRHGKILDGCADLFQKGELRIVVGKTLPFEEAAQAHALIEEGHGIGKIVLTMPLRTLPKGEGHAKESG